MTCLLLPFFILYFKVHVVGYFLNFDNCCMLIFFTLCSVLELNCPNSPNEPCILLYFSPFNVFFIGIGNVFVLDMLTFLE